MSIFGLLIALIIIGVVLWLVNTLIPIDPKIKTIINAIVIILVLLWVLSMFFGGFDSPVFNRPIGRWR